MSEIPFGKEDLQIAVEQYKTKTRGMSSRTLDTESFWDEETQMLAKFPETFQQAGCIPELKHLKCLTKWKWPGLWENHAHNNSREELRTVTSQAFQLTADHQNLPADKVRQQLHHLTNLSGISAATGTVLLTFWRPSEYTVMDQRALSTLERADVWAGDSEANITEFPEYLDICSSISTQTGLSLRDTDRALWALGD